jgi:hypothetical protein
MTGCDCCSGGFPVRDRTLDLPLIGRAEDHRAPGLRIVRTFQEAQDGDAILRGANHP